MGVYSRGNLGDCATWCAYAPLPDNWLGSSCSDCAAIAAGTEVQEGGNIATVGPVIPTSMCPPFFTLAPDGTCTNPCGSQQPQGDGTGGYTCFTPSGAPQAPSFNICPSGSSGVPGAAGTSVCCPPGYVWDGTTSSGCCPSGQVYNPADPTKCMTPSLVPGIANWIIYSAAGLLMLALITSRGGK